VVASSFVCLLIPEAVVRLFGVDTNLTRNEHIETAVPV
jgi:hypothetical protein